MTNYEDVLGADKAGRELRARDHAALYEIAKRTPELTDQERTATLERIITDYLHAGLLREVHAARRELIEIYRLDDQAPAEALAVLREMVEPVVEASRPDDPGVEDYRRDEGMPL